MESFFFFRSSDHTKSTEIAVLVLIEQFSIRVLVLGPIHMYAEEFEHNPILGYLRSFLGYYRLKTAVLMLDFLDSNPMGALVMGVSSRTNPNYFKVLEDLHW